MRSEASSRESGCINSITGFPISAAGLVAPAEAGGYESKVLDQIVINLAVPNNLSFTGPIYPRVLLTDTIEATTVGNTILLSKGRYCASSIFR